VALNRERILILAKTYPSPSSQYVETSCVAGINEDGAMRRLFPVPFRFLDGEQQFSKWQWIEANIEKARNDHRPESYRIDIGTLTCGQTIAPQNGWSLRSEWLNKIPTFESMDELQTWAATNKGSLALLRPLNLLSLETIRSRQATWTTEDLRKLNQAQTQNSLLTEPESRDQLEILKKLPVDFYYRYTCPNNPADIHRHKVVDWEAGALYRNVVRRHSSAWEQPFRQKLLDQMQTKEMMFLMGNQHRFQDQWLIISLIYPPRQVPLDSEQATLF
jgi:hypothetical protein